MRKMKKSFFTLVEVLVSMGVFSLLMLALMQFFSAAQGVWEKTGNRAELFESAKTAMNLLANDLACAYYENDYDQSQFKYFDISTSDTTQITFAARKENGNTQIFYKWNDSEWKLHRVEKTEAEVFAGTATPAGNWFTRSGKKGWITEMSGTDLSDGKHCLAENVLDFSISAHAKNDLNTPIAPTAEKPLPDVIIVSMTLLSSDAHEKLLNRLTDDGGIRNFFKGTAENSTFGYLKNGTEASGKMSIKEILRNGYSLVESSNDSTESILFNGCQRFTRVIPLDCGQN